MTPGKLAGMKAVSNDRGVIAAAAMDQRGSLQKALAKEKGGDVGDREMEEFKSLVTEVLTQHASAILLDPEWGLPASKRRAKGCRAAARLREDRLRRDTRRTAAGPARRLVGAPAEGSGRRLHQDPALLHAVRSGDDQQHQARVGRAHRRRVPRQRHPVLPRVRRLRRRRRREGARLREEEAGDRHRQHGGVHEGPLRRRRDEGRSAGEHEVRRGHAGRSAARRPTRGRRRWMPSDAPPTSRPSPFIYLSAGVSNAEFTETLELAGEAGTRFSGVLCGRATWKDGIAVYGKQGAAAFQAVARRPGRQEHQQRQRPPQAGATVVRVLRREVGGGASASQSPATSFQSDRAPGGVARPGRRCCTQLSLRTLDLQLPAACERRDALEADSLSVALQILYATDLPKARVPRVRAP